MSNTEENVTEKNAESDSTKCGVQKNFTSGQVGLNVKDRNLVKINQPMTPYIPFSLKVRLPKPDHGKRGFSDAYINKVRKRLYGKDVDLVSGS